MSTAAGAGHTRAMDDITLPLRGDHITLDALLKATGLAASGGDAKTLIASGGVSVNGSVEQRRGRKLRAGDRVQCGPSTVQVTRPEPGAAPA